MFGRTVIALVALGAAACGAARIVEISPVGGVVALQGDRDFAMGEARTEMDAQCGVGNYSIVRQWEQPSGASYATTSSDVHLQQIGSGVYRGDSTTQVATGPVMEWRMEFRCGGRTVAPKPPQ